MVDFLPIKVKPYQDELFTSWLVRSARKYGLKVHSFSHLVFPSQQIWNRDTDLYPKDELISRWALLNDLNYSDVIDTTLKDEMKADYHLRTIILSMDKYHRNVRNRGVVYCPLCLNEKPYFKKVWRLGIYTACSKHKCQVNDSCPHCDASIQFYRHEMGDRDKLFSGTMKDCWRCKKSLIGGISSDINEIPSRRLLQLMSLLEESMTYSTVKKGNSWMYSLGYLMGVACLTRILLTAYMDIGKDLNIYLSENKLKCDKINEDSFSKRVTRLPLSERRIISNYLSYLLEARYFPDRLISSLEQVDFRYQTLTKDGGIIPYWLHLQLNSFKRPIFGENAYFY